MDPRSSMTLCNWWEEQVLREGPTATELQTLEGFGGKKNERNVDGVGCIGRCSHDCRLLV